MGWGGGRQAEAARQWSALCHKLSREHRRAAIQFTAHELVEYVEWVAEQWDMAALAPARTARLRRLADQVASHRRMIIKLRSLRSKGGQHRTGQVIPFKPVGRS